MDLRYDLIYCYSKFDDSEPGIRNNWVENLQKLLNLFFERRLGYLPKSEKLTEDDIFEKKDSKLYIVILSDAFLRDGKCLSNLASIENSLHKENHEESYFPRVFKILPRKMPVEKQPSFLKKYIDYCFFDSYIKNLEEYIFDPLQPDNKFSQKTIILGYDIFDSLKAINQTDEITDSASIKNTVYLSLTPPDQVGVRDILSRELQTLGYNVLPKYSAPDDANEFEKFVVANLQNAGMSVHVFGSEPGYIPANGNLPIEFTQNQLAAEYFQKTNKNNTGAFSRVIWIPPSLLIPDEKHMIALERLKQDPLALQGAELVQTPVELLKTIILKKMEAKSNLAAKITDNNLQGEKKLYLVYDPKDSEMMKPISEFLEKRNISTMHLIFEKNYVNSVLNHRNLLVECDGVVVFYNQDVSDWLKSKVQDIRKAPGFGRNADFKCKFLITKSKGKIDEVLKKDNFEIITTKNIYSPETLEPVIQKMEMQ